MRIEKLRANHDIDLAWTQFPLHPDTPPGGRDLREMFGPAVDEMQERMRELMAAEGLPYADRTRTFNSRLAQELAKWAETKADGAGIHDAIFRAYFAEATDISDPDELVRIAEEEGLSPDEARQVLTERSFSKEVDLDWERSRNLGVTGVPTFLAERHAVVGAQPYEILEHLLEIASRTPPAEQP